MGGMGGNVVKNWSPRNLISFLKKNGFSQWYPCKGDHCCLYNPKTKAYTEVDKGRGSFSAREMLQFIGQSKIEKKYWIKGKKIKSK